MQAAKGKFRGILLITAGLMAFGWQVTTKADSWQRPQEFDTASENGKFVARVVPATQDRKGVLIVSDLKSGKTNEIWRTQLSNNVAPTEVRLTNDGESVLTLDNWFGAGYGDDVVAIYNRHGQLTKYSLEQIDAGTKSKTNQTTEPAIQSEGESSLAGIRTSTSSRWWRTDGIEVFTPEGKDASYCAWLDWANQWAAWSLRNGRQIRVTSKLAAKFNNEVRVKAITLAKLALHDSPPAGYGMFAAEGALRFLAHHRAPEARPLVEAWLRDIEFGCGYISGGDLPDGTPRSFSFFASSPRRQAGDKMLALWDGKKIDDALFDGPNNAYCYLGTLECAVLFATAPTKGAGTIHVYIIPESTSLNDWFSRRPDQYLTADLAKVFPSIFEDGQRRDGALSKLVNFRIDGVTPGKYRIKVVWDRAAPFANDGNIVYRPQRGDFESTTSPLFEISAGLVTEQIRIECQTPVNN